MVITAAHLVRAAAVLRSVALSTPLRPAPATDRDGPFGGTAVVIAVGTAAELIAVIAVCATPHAALLVGTTLLTRGARGGSTRLSWLLKTVVDIVLPSLLDTRLFPPLVLDLLAFRQCVVGFGVLGTMPAEQGERTADEAPTQRAQRRTTRGRFSQESRQFIKSLSVHLGLLLAPTRRRCTPPTFLLPPSR
jgi:hypothetical protein